MTNKNTLRPPETVYIDQDTVFCDGGNGSLGHPRVYLTVDKTTQTVECPYCDKCFIKGSKKDR